MMLGEFGPNPFSESLLILLLSTKSNPDGELTQLNEFILLVDQQQLVSRLEMFFKKSVAEGYKFEFCMIVGQSSLEHTKPGKFPLTDVYEFSIIDSGFNYLSVIYYDLPGTKLHLSPVDEANTDLSIWSANKTDSVALMIKEISKHLVVAQSMALV